MPKIQQIKGHNDTSFQIDNIPRRDFSQFNNQSFSFPARKSIHDSVVPIHEVSYNPQFSKSPLANVEMEKYVHIQPRDVHQQESIYYDFKSRIEELPQAQKQKSTWKTMLLRLLIVLLILGLIVGLYFVVDAILSHRLTQQPQQQQTPNQNAKPSSSVGVAPIYFDPISYESISTYSTPTQSSPSLLIQKNSIPPQTFPSVLPSQQSQQYSTSSTGGNSQDNQSKSNTNTLSNKNDQTYLKTSPQQINYDPEQNSIAPLNAYENTH